MIDWNVFICSQREQITFRRDETSREGTRETIDSHVQDNE